MWHLFTMGDILASVGAAECGLLQFTAALTIPASHGPLSSLSWLRFPGDRTAGTRQRAHSVMSGFR